MTVPFAASSRTPSLAVASNPSVDPSYVTSADSSVIFWPPTSMNVAMLLARTTASAGFSSGIVTSKVLLRLSASFSP